MTTMKKFGYSEDALTSNFLCIFLVKELGLGPVMKKTQRKPFVETGLLEHLFQKQEFPIEILLLVNWEVVAELVANGIYCKSLFVK